MPRQPQNQHIELLQGQRDGCFTVLPEKPPLMQPTLCQPDTVTIAQKYLQAVAAAVGEQPDMVRLRRTHLLYDPRQQTIRPVRMSTGSVASHH